ncbi:MAG: carboxylesterase/lipase family protein [Acidobacteria bacterium]|nr:carboxylesterase/lipase family protein [Acidobacteriota bacterium]
MNNQNRAIVKTTCGELEGVLEDNLYVFKGVPYAAPPIGALRWLPPQPFQPWQGVRAAKSYGPIAPQNAMALPGISEKPEPQSEGCLFLNVFTPGLDNARRPVMVWIHGGAFCMGSGSMQMYSTGTLAADGNIVLVTINYRLGVLGFLNLRELTKGRIPSTGNEGLQDQILALRWVKENIEAFGGDPDNVTVFGESAGAMSVGCLLTLPGARGLFHKAILESPVGEMARPLDMSVEIAREFLRTVEVRADDIPAIRSLPLDRMLRAQQIVAAKMGQGGAPVIPVADGVVMPSLPLTSLEAGRGLKVPTLVGSNLEEDKLFSMMTPKVYGIDEEGLRKAAAKFVVERDAEKLIETYRNAKASRGESVTPFEIYSALSTDVMFRKTAIRVAEAQCRHAAGGYNYLFCWKSPAAGGRLGACHALEVGFVFGNYDASFGGSGPEAEKLSKEMQDAWTSFARTGNPSGKSLGEWPQYSNGRAVMIFDKTSRVKEAPYEQERRVWESLEVLEYSNMP